MIRFNTALVVALALLTSACAEKQAAASIDNTPYQKIVINTPGVTGASCVVQSGGNTYAVLTPGAVTVRRAPDAMSVSCFKGNHMKGNDVVRPSFAPREGEKVRGTQSACITCNYPNTVTIAMSLNGHAMNVPVTVWR
ncbi:MAG TPA: hypothetical protein VEF76_06825 [Patescibacteria group bacterium]|nr:hypothetical protein [Patescibacteria group bacterium]